VISTNGAVTKTTDYIGGMQYEGNTLLMKQTAFGRLRLAGSAVVCEYYIKDHPRDLGVGAPKSSNRVTFSDPNADGVADLLQEDHYYPFGLKMSDGTQTTSPPNTYRYNGKEYQDELGLAWYDSILRWGRGPVSESRMYDPRIGRWNGMDALAEKYAAWSPFVYVLNNPVILLDPKKLEVVNGHQKELDEEKTRAAKAQAVYENNVRFMSPTPANYKRN
jgi:RHS repeat-associated protein